MRNSKFGLRVLGLSLLAAVGMMAFTVTAQAQDLASPATNSPGEILINLSTALLATFIGQQELEPEGKLLVAGRNLEIRCPHGHLSEGKIVSGKEALVKVEYLKCLAFVHKTGEHIASCVVTNGGTIVATAKALPFLHNGLDYVLFEPDQTQKELEEKIVGTFATVSFEAGKGCALPLNNPVRGEVNAEVEFHNAVEQLLLFSQAIQLLTGGTLSFGGFPSYINAEAEGELTGEHDGDSWGVH